MATRFPDIKNHIYDLLFCPQVKADRNSKKLGVLQQASRHVNEMTAKVVASTKTGQENLDVKGGSGSICEKTRNIDRFLTVDALQSNRTHGLLWNVSHQAEKRRNGGSGKF